MALLAVIGCTYLDTTNTFNEVQKLETDYEEVVSQQENKYTERIQKLDKKIKSTQKKMKALQKKIDNLDLDNTTTSTVTQKSTGNKISRETPQKSETKSTSTTNETSSGNKNFIGNFTITYYCTENYPHICGTGNGQTASGAKATPGVTIAADTSVLPMGTKVYIDGIGERVVQDVGGAVKGNHIDVCVSTHSEAMRKGRHSAKVYRVNE